MTFNKKILLESSKAVSERKENKMSLSRATKSMNQHNVCAPVSIYIVKKFE